MTYQKSANYQAYRTASETLPKTRQIVMLYDGAVRAVQQAREAIEQKQYEERYKKLLKASEILMGLQSCLDYDSGAEMAQILFDYYSSLDARILTIHRSNSLEMCDRVIDELKEMRSAWQEIDQNAESGGAAPKGMDAEAAISGMQVSV